MWTWFMWFGASSVPSSCCTWQCPIKLEEFLDKLNDYQLFKMVPATRNFLLIHGCIMHWFHLLPWTCSENSMKFILNFILIMSKLACMNWNYVIPRKSAPHPWSRFGNEKCGLIILFEFFMQITHNKSCFNEPLPSVRFPVLAGRAMPPWRT